MLHWSSGNNAINWKKTSSDINNSFSYDVILCKLERENSVKWLKQTQQRQCGTILQMLQCHPKPKTIPNWFFTNVGALCTIVSELYFYMTGQAEQSSHKGWNWRRMFLAIEATGRRPKNNNEVRQYHTFLHMIFLWGNEFTMSHDDEAYLWVLVPLEKKKKHGWQQTRIQASSFTHLHGT